MKLYKTTAVPDFQLINAYARIGDYERVRAIWLEFLKTEPNNAQYHISLAATYLKLNEREKAVAELQRAAEINPAFKEQAEYYIKEIRSGKNF